MSTAEMARRGADMLRGELTDFDAVHGGDLSQVVRIVLRDGREAAVKGGPAPRAEAAMLVAISASGAPAPDVLAVDDDLLVIEWLAATASLGEAWGSLGTALSALHGAAGRRYGWDCDYAFGAVAIRNGWEDSWPDFWGQRRLLAHGDSIPAALRRRLETLAAQLDERLPARPAPALLHGDLWTGNVLAAGGQIAGLIDPACYYGHCEVDFAMLGLFGQPRDALYESYGDLEPGHRSRLAVYQLWPALVHLRLFGRSYAPLVERLLSAAGV